MKFSGKMCFMIIIKVPKSQEIFRKDVPYANIKSHKSQGFTFSLEDPLFQRPLEYGVVGSNYPPPPRPPFLPSSFGVKEWTYYCSAFSWILTVSFFLYSMCLFYYCSHFLSQLSHQ